MPTICEFTFEYGTFYEEQQTEDLDEKGNKIFTKVAKISPDQYKKLRELLPDLDENIFEVRQWHSYVADITSIIDIVPTIRIIRKIKTNNSNLELYNFLSKAEHTLDDLKALNSQLFNKKLEVHMPGNSLLEISNVIVVENACTEAIDQKLQDGWRILAVCPQPDQRRPDYIMGK